MLLVVDPVTVICVAVLESVQAMAVAFAQAEGAIVSGARVVYPSTVTVRKTIDNLALVVFAREVVVGEVALQLVREIACESAELEVALGVCKCRAGCKCVTLLSREW